MAGDLVTNSQLLEALEKVVLLDNNIHEKKSDEFTSLDYAIHKGISVNLAYKRLKRLYDQGKLEMRRPSKEVLWRLKA